MRIVGLDIGGANLKAASADGRAVSNAFALWKHPEQLAERLGDLANAFFADRIAATMTGELCDCFASKREGVRHIVAAIETAFPGREIGVWSTAATFLTPAEAQARPLEVAAANWHALATYVGTLSPRHFTLLVDLGSTTCDIIPIANGRPCTVGRTDPERLRHGELVYTGVRRTPLCALLGMSHAAEWFATTRDAYLLLGEGMEDPADLDTPDGRPATLACAHARMARMACDDRDGMPLAAAQDLARQVRDVQVAQLADAVRRCVSRSGQVPATIFTSGSGEFLLPDVLAAAGLGNVPVESLSGRLGPEISEAACAYAAARLLASFKALESYGTLK